MTKYNLGSAHRLTLPEGRKIILIPAQVDDDASIKFGSPEIKSSFSLLKKIRAENPESFLIFKPHPDVVAGYRTNTSPLCEVEQYADLVITDMRIDQLYEMADEVHVLTSLSGFEALLRGKKVVTYGLPFYAGWGLTHDKCRCKRRMRNRTLEELVLCFSI